MPPSNLTKITYWEFLGGEELVMSEVALTPATLPVMRPGFILEISAVGGYLRYAINGTASAVSHGYVPENGARIIGPLSNWTGITIWGLINSIACLTLYRDNVK